MKQMLVHLVKQYFVTLAEAHRALELLEEYHKQIRIPENKELQLALEKAIRTFKKNLFHALLGKYLMLLFYYYSNIKIVNFSFPQFLILGVKSYNIK